MDRRIDKIEPGFFAVRLVRGGPLVPARIAIIDGIYFVSECGGPPSAIVAVDELPELIVQQTIDGEAFNHPLLRLAWFGRRITEARYCQLLDLMEWARACAPDHPMATPWRAVDLNDVPADVFFPEPKE